MRVATHMIERFLQALTSPTDPNPITCAFLKINLEKHGISFKEESTTFEDPLSLTIDDPLHSRDEERWVLVGMSYKNRMLVVIHTERGDHIRIISARKATKKEREYYESNV